LFMAIEIKTGPSKAALVSELAASVKLHKDIFNATYILTPGAAQNTWLKEELAERNKIAAHIKFINLDAFLGLLDYRLCGLKTGERFSTENLIWIIFELLGSREFKKKFPEIAKYSGKDEVKRLALAQKTVKLFDQYQDYRPEMIQG